MRVDLGAWKPGCWWHRRWLLPYAEGGLSLEERARVSRHLAFCPACREEMQTLLRTAGMVRAATPPVPSATPDLWKRLQPLLEEQSRVSPASPVSRPRRSALAPYRLPASLAAAGALAAAGWFLLFPPDSHPGSGPGTASPRAIASKPVETESAPVLTVRPVPHASKRPGTQEPVLSKSPGSRMPGRSASAPATQPVAPPLAGEFRPAKLHMPAAIRLQQRAGTTSGRPSPAVVPGEETLFRSTSKPVIVALRPLTSPDPRVFSAPDRDASLDSARLAPSMISAPFPPHRAAIAVNAPAMAPLNAPAPGSSELMHSSLAAFSPEPGSVGDQSEERSAAPEVRGLVGEVIAAGDRLRLARDGSTDTVWRGGGAPANTAPGGGRSLETVSLLAGSRPFFSRVETLDANGNPVVTSAMWGAGGPGGPLVVAQSHPGPEQETGP